MPYNADNVLVINPADNSTSNIDISGVGLSAGGSKFYGGTLGMDGKIYGVPRNAQKILIVDPETDGLDTIDLSGVTGFSDTGNQYSGAVLSPNGKIYFAPVNSNNVLILKTGLPKIPQWVLAPEFNKF